MTKDHSKSTVEASYITVKMAFIVTLIAGYACGWGYC